MGENIELDHKYSMQSLVDRAFENPDKNRILQPPEDHVIDHQEIRETWEAMPFKKSIYSFYTLRDVSKAKKKINLSDPKERSKFKEGIEVSILAMESIDNFRTDVIEAWKKKREEIFPAPLPIDEKISVLINEGYLLSDGKTICASSLSIFISKLLELYDPTLITADYIYDRFQKKGEKKYSLKNIDNTLSQLRSI